MNAYVKSERLDLEEKLERLYEERHKAIGDVEKFMKISGKINAIELKLYTWRSRNRRYRADMRSESDFGVKVMFKNYN